MCECASFVFLLQKRQHFKNLKSTLNQYKKSKWQRQPLQITGSISFQTLHLVFEAEWN